jgi:tetratricopeptide (TPR) repeat protein
MADFNAAIAAYQRAFEIEPRLALAVYVNHEYGFTLAQVGRFDEAARGFERMKQEGEAVNQSKGFRSAALLEMLRGRYGNAIRELRRAISLDQTYNEMLSEFRDRLYLITAFEATARERDARDEWADVERLIAKLSLSPGWLWRAARMKARSGRLDDAQRYVRNMQQWVGKATADSGVSRNLAEDDFYVAASEAELALAEGRLARALERIEPAHLYLKSPETLATLAAVDAAAGRAAEAIARYEELVSKPAMGYEAQETWLAAHVALGRLYEQQRRPADATKIYLALADRWKGGDGDLVLLRTARARLQALQQQ